jgi:hypothetical protein
MYNIDMSCDVGKLDKSLFLLIFVSYFCWFEVHRRHDIMVIDIHVKQLWCLKLNPAKPHNEIPNTAYMVTMQKKGKTQLMVMCNIVLDSWLTFNKC